MSGGGMQGTQGVGTAASGGKGGQSGGPNMNAMSQQVFDPNYKGGFEDYKATGSLPSVIGGGGSKGGQKPYVPDESGGRLSLPTSQPGMVSQKDNAFDQGLGGMDLAMDWMQNAMGSQSPTLNGDYNVGGLDAKKYMSQMGTAGGGGYSAAMMTAPSQDLYDYEAALAQGQSYGAAQLSDKDINDYMNPYTQNVIDTTMGDLDKARQMALNSTGAAATAGGAFGGDRHGIMEAQNNADFMDQVARSSAQLRNQGYQNAQAAAMGDVNALNQSYQSNAAMAQQAGLANQAAQNARSQFVGGTANQNAMQTGLANQSAANQAAALGAQLSAQASIANANNKNALLSQLMGYDNSNQQFNAGMNFSKDQFNAGQAQQQFMNQMSAAQNMYGMGNDRWNMGEKANQNMANVGSQIDQINQGYLNQIQNMFNNQQNAPQQQFQQMLAAMSGQPNWGGTQTYNPGFFDYAGLATGLGAGYLSGGGKFGKGG
jgi:hypothetical protein